jgi:hypothetical protein
MLEITASTLERFYRVAQLRTPPGPAAGPQSRSCYYTFHYDGSNELGFWWTDCQTTFFIKLPVKPRDGTPWIVSVRASDYPICATKSSKQVPRSSEEAAQEGHSGFDAVLRYLPEIMRAKPAGQQNETGGFLFKGTPRVTLSVDLKSVFRTLDGRKKVLLRMNWEKPETLVTVTANTPTGKRDIVLRDWEKLDGRYYGYLEHDFQLTDMLAEDGPQAKLRLHVLRKLLRFLARGQKKQDPGDHGQRLTLFQDACAMGAHHAHRGGVVMLAAKGPPLPSHVQLDKGTAETIAKWLMVVSQDTELKADTIVLVDLTATKKPRYEFRDPTGRYRLWVSAARRSFLRLPVDRILSVQPRFALKVNRKELQNNAKMLGALSYDRALICRVVAGSDGACQIHLEAKHDESHSHGVLDAVLHASEGEVFTGWSFIVSARDVLCALGHFSAKEVFLVSRPSPVQTAGERQLDYGGRQLAICAAKPTEADWKAPIAAAFVRITPTPAAVEGTTTAHQAHGSTDDTPPSGPAPQSLPVVEAPRSNGAENDARDSDRGGEE